MCSEATQLYGAQIAAINELAAAYRAQSQETAIEILNVVDRK